MAFDMPSAGLQSDRYGLGRIRLHPFQGGKKTACCFNFWVLTALLTAYPKIYIYISPGGMQNCPMHSVESPSDSLGKWLGMSYLLLLMSFQTTGGPCQTQESHGLCLLACCLSHTGLAAVRFNLQYVCDLHTALREPGERSPCSATGALPPGSHIHQCLMPMRSSCWIVWRR